MKQEDKIIAILLTFLLMLCLPAHPVFASEQDDFSVAAKAAISVDEETGKILYEQNSDQVLAIASTTKLLSMYIVEKEIKAGKLSWEDTVDIPDDIAELSLNSDLSNVPLYTDQTYTVKDLFHAAAIESANAATQALAIKVAGSENKFVDKMQAELKILGITDTKIVNSTGLPNEYLEDLYPGSSKKDENKMSAKDLAILTRHLLKEFPDFLTVSSIATETFAAQTDHPYEMESFNKMLADLSEEKAGVDGLKTGTTDLAGACFVGTIKHENQRIITVVLNASNHEKDEAARFKETSKLMDFSLSQWQEKTVLQAGSVIPEHANVAVENGKKLTSTVIAGEDINLWLPKDISADTVDYKVKLDNVRAPVKKNQQMGTVTATVSADKYGFLPDENSPEEVKLLSKDANPKANILVRAWRAIKEFVEK
ncbi:MAG TPA: serine hydrolase [Tetragenococcus sp.]|nr:serine hydrolase [Tetragenococcus sp.]